MVINPGAFSFLNNHWLFSYSVFLQIPQFATIITKSWDWILVSNRFNNFFTNFSHLNISSDTQHSTNILKCSHMICSWTILLLCFSHVLFLHSHIPFVYFWFLVGNDEVAMIQCTRTEKGWRLTSSRRKDGEEGVLIIATLLWGFNKATEYSCCGKYSSPRSCCFYKTGCSLYIGYKSQRHIQIT
jgi:hypothetical protein